MRKQAVQITALTAVIMASIWFAAAHAKVTLNDNEDDVIGVSFLSGNTETAEVPRSDEISAQRRVR